MPEILQNVDGCLDNWVFPSVGQLGWCSPSWTLANDLALKLNAFLLCSFNTCVLDCRVELVQQNRVDGAEINGE